MVSNPGLLEMAGVIVTLDRYETIRETMSISGRRGSEIGWRSSSPLMESLDLDDSELDEFLPFRIVAVGEVSSIAKAWAAGIRQASAPVVAFLEDHSYPAPCWAEAPSWAEAPIKAHQKAWAAVGPVLANANPNSMIGWLMLFGQWSAYRTG